MLSAIPSYSPYKLSTESSTLRSFTLFYPIDSRAPSRHVVRLIKRNRDCAIALRVIREPDYHGQFRLRFYLQFIAPRHIFIRATYEINTSATVDRFSAAAWIKIPPPASNLHFELRDVQ